MISKTKIGKRVTRKQDPEVVATIIEAKKHDAWRALAQAISGSRRQYASVNLHQIEQKVQVGDTVVVPGKILAAGNLTKKITICALTVSKSARQKAQSSKSEFISIRDQIKKNPKAEGVVFVQ